MPEAVKERASRARTKRLPLALSVLAATVLLLTGCGFFGKGGADQGAFGYSGNWRGTVADEDNGAGTLLVTLQQDGHALAGTWHVVMGGNPARQDGGSWAGQLFVGKDGDLLTATLSPAVAGECSYTLTLSRTNEAMSGTYVPAGAAQACAQLVRGSVQLSKQQ